MRGAGFGGSLVNVEAQQIEIERFAGAHDTIELPHITGVAAVKGLDLGIGLRHGGGPFGPFDETDIDQCCREGEPVDDLPNHTDVKTGAYAGNAHVLGVEIHIVDIALAVGLVLEPLHRALEPGIDLN